jgi:hypothetical protein
VGESITHYPGDGRPAGPAHVLTIGGNVVLATFDADAALLAPNAKQRADFALAWIVKRDIPLLQRTFSLAKPTATSDESAQLYVGLQAATVSSAGWWTDAVNGHGRWARVRIGLSSTGALGASGGSFTNALQILGHETMHTYQYRWRYGWRRRVHARMGARERHVRGPQRRQCRVSAPPRSGEERLMIAPSILRCVQRFHLAN